MPQAKAAVAASKTLAPGKARKLSDGRSVALVCKAGRAFWVLNFRDPNTGKLRSAGLGAFPETSPQQARIKADALRSGAPPLVAAERVNDFETPFVMRLASERV
jgi:hypothetical protein